MPYIPDHELVRLKERLKGEWTVETLREAGESPTCPTCTGPKAAEPHPCPYAEEVNGDSMPCECCEHCESECGRDV